MKPLIAITGMHRSGTSFLARACNLGGVYLGELEELMTHEWKTNQDNKRGHWENSSLLQLSDEILLHSNGKWDHIPEKICCNEKMGLKVKDVFEKIAKPPSLACGFKDPRFPILYETLLKYIPQNFISMVIFRHPLKVAESLAKRNGFDYEKSIKLWTIYNERILTLLEKHPGFVFSFDWKKKKIINELKMVFGKIGLCWTVNLDEWYSKELLHADDTYDSSYTIPPETQRLYDRLLELSTMNDEMNLKVMCSPDNPRELRNTLYETIQNQGIHFNKLHHETINKHLNTQTEIESLKEKMSVDTQKYELNIKSLKEKISLDAVKYYMEIESLKEKMSVDAQKFELNIESLKKKIVDAQKFELEIESLKETVKEKDETIEFGERRISDIAEFLEKEQKRLATYKEQMLLIHNSFSWKMLHKLDKIKNRSQ